jgi:hypothetical protein
VASTSEQEAPKAGHPKIAAVLIGLGTLLAIFAIFSIWANRQALNTDNWVDTSGKVLQNEEVRSQLSAYLASQLFANVDVQSELAKALPPKLQALAGPAAGGLSQLAPQVAERALATSQVQALWAEANRAAHESLLELLDGGNNTISTEGGDVTLDLSSVLTRVGEQLGVGDAIASKVPADAGKLTILESGQISTAQNVAQGIRSLPIVLTLLVLILYGLAIFLAGPRRRQALRSAGLGFVFAGALALIIRGIAGNEVVNALSTNEAAKPAAEAVWEIGTSLLVTVAASAIAFGILVFLGAWLAGPTRLATGIRHEASPYLRDQPLGAFVVALAVFIALLAWAPIAAFHKPLGILLFAILFVLGAEVLRRQTLREFPDAERGEIGAGMRARRSGRASAPAPAAAGGAAEIDQLERLSALRRDGDLTADEFEAAKAQILSTSSPSEPA